MEAPPSLSGCGVIGDAPGKDSLGQQHGNTLAPFISKLFEILSMATPDGSIKWGHTGDTIIVTNQGKFAREVLPRYFKHDNIRSFIRQLNIYGFQRCRNPERAGSVEGEHGELEFYHEHFLEGRKDLMRLISRGMPSHKRITNGDGSHVLPPPLPPTAHPPSTPLNLSHDAQQLASEMTWVHKHIASVDTQLRSQAHHVQSRLTSLVEALAASHQAQLTLSMPTYTTPSLVGNRTPMMAPEPALPALIAQDQRVQVLDADVPDDADVSDDNPTGAGDHAAMTVEVTENGGRGGEAAPVITVSAKVEEMD